MTIPEKDTRLGEAWYCSSCATHRKAYIVGQTGSHPGAICCTHCQRMLQSNFTREIAEAEHATVRGIHQLQGEKNDV